MGVVHMHEKLGVANAGTSANMGISICHIIVDLNVGGAELMLTRLVNAQLRDPRLTVSVVSLTDLGDLGPEMAAQGISVHALGLTSFRKMPVVMWRLVALLRHINPDIVQTWMHHSNFIGGLAARYVGIRHVIWGIRNTFISQGKFSRTHFVIELCARLSRVVPQCIVCCAEAGRRVHAELGYASEKMRVIQNGYELSDFETLPANIPGMKKKLEIPDDALVIGTVARFYPLKDYKNFINAAALVAAQRPDVYFLMIGREVDESNAVLQNWVNATGMPHRFKLLGQRSDVAHLMAVMDVFCLASCAEGFPNVVAEAMASRVPCVVTDVGDAAMLVNGMGYVVPPQSASDLADGLLTMLALPPAERVKIGNNGHQLIAQRYSMDAIAEQYCDLYIELLA